ncbi:hypothetical protein ACFSKL_01630 [Belliella marina]|uniref:Por secretion system C-terminal sorting domain-containing protein n=1 Tax=Belliella marina TaxID=1644146 RepID=A0ABW4VI38_9BACT
MNKPIDRKYILNISILFIILLMSSFSFVSNAQIFKKRTKVEAEISFPADLNRERVSFDLKADGIKKFSIVLDKKPVEITKVKVFDTLGNLLFEDRIMPDDDIKKSYDLSHIQSQLFVVEVGNSKYNITKSIYAIPPGSKKKTDVQVNK